MGFLIGGFFVGVNIFVVLLYLVWDNGILFLFIVVYFNILVMCVFELLGNWFGLEYISYE